MNWNGIIAMAALFLPPLVVWLLSGAIAKVLRRDRARRSPEARGS